MSSEVYKGGVIIIGSLLWDEQSAQRVTWRNRLLIGQKISVSVPIRYGRLSSGEIYTMVFSEEAQNKGWMGKGYVCPFKLNAINPDLVITEARELAKAENRKRSNNGLVNSDGWGAIGLLFNPQIEEFKKQILLKKWSESFQADLNGRNVEDFHMSNEKACINNAGELKINWPSCFDTESQKKLNEFDFLIATVTKPSNSINDNQYPSPDSIANGVDLDKVRFYFVNNIQSGIRTNIDRDIYLHIASKEIKKKLKTFFRSSLCCFFNKSKAIKNIKDEQPETI